MRWRRSGAMRWLVSIEVEETFDGQFRLEIPSRWTLPAVPLLSKTMVA